MSSIGNTNRDIRKFLRDSGVAPTLSNVERIGREVRRSESQNDTVVRIHKELERERGIPATRDERGDVKARVKAKVKQNLQRRTGR